MTTGTSVFIIAVGAILRYAVNDRINDVDLSTVGLILMIAGAVGVVLSLIHTAAWSKGRRRDVVVRDRR